MEAVFLLHDGIRDPLAFLTIGHGLDDLNPLPFSFIRSTDRIYFYTRYRGSKRYFYYDVGRQEQIEPPAVSNDTDWEAYKRLRGDR